MAQAPLHSRRHLLQLASLGGAALAVGSLTGCRRGAEAGRLLTVRGQLPPAWLKALPSAWRSQVLETPAELLERLRRPSDLPSLSSLGDGWVQQLPPGLLQPIEAAALLEALDPIAQAPSRLFAGPDAAAKAFPWAFGTWVILLRNRPDLVRRQGEGWSLLLDPSLRQRLVLPASPRLLLEFARRQLSLPAGVEDPRLVEQLRRLHAQAISLDERQGLNFLLAGDADAAVVTSQRAVPLLQRDPRLAAVLPASGSPLWWQLLVRTGPAGSPLPLEWIRDGLSLPLLDRLLAAGWVPPLPAAVLQPALRRWPQRLRPLLLPPPDLLARCTNLPPLTPTERQGLQLLWDQAMAG
jgi:putative spermidine/putrescine transport system substrate-binding protein